jgi:signal transduction histidine kinase
LLDRRRPHLVGPVLELGQPIVVPEVTDEYIRSIAQSEAHHAALRALSARSVLAVPMAMDGRCLGALALISSRPSRRYGARDLYVAEELARRAALALDSARHHDAVRQAVRARDEALGDVAHDLRTPLNAIALWTSFLQQEAADHAAAPQDALERIMRSTARAERMVRDLLDTARVESGRLTVTPERQDTADLLAEGVEAVRPAATAALVSLEVDVAPDVPPVLADRSRALQVIENLAGNAVKFAPRGTAVTVGARRDGGEVVFRVADRGPGLPPESLAHVFDRFWQARRADRRGAGMGLAIARGIVEAHGGRIWVESTPGVGATFFFTLPVA